MNVDGHKSESENATTGVPQGSVLGSLVSLLNVHEVWYAVCIARLLPM